MNKEKRKGSAEFGVQLTGRELACLAHEDSVLDAPAYFSLSYFLH